DRITVLLGNPHLDETGAKYVSGGYKPSGKELVQRDVLLVGNFLNQLQCSGRVLFSVQRKRRSVSGEALAVCVISVLFLELRGVRQQYLQQIGRAQCGINRTLETIPHKTGEIAGMVDMRVGEKHPGDRRG